VTNNPPAPMTAQERSRTVTEEFPYDLRYYRPELERRIADQIRQAEEAAREKGYKQGLEDGQEGG
jgi:hypothetical protein